MINFMLHNLDHLAPILLLAAMGTAIIFERLRSLFVVYPLHGATAFFERVRYLVMADRVSEAIALCDRLGSKPVSTIVKEGLMRAHQPEEILEHGLEICAGEQVDRVKARTGYLSMIANVATLLGLIGTILGLIQSFEAVGSANAQARSALLAQGISVAMNHTLWGLSVAVPCMVFYSFLMNRTNRLKAELDRSVVRTLDILKQRYVAGEGHAPSPNGSDYGGGHHGHGSGQGRHLRRA